MFYVGVGCAIPAIVVTRTGWRCGVTGGVKNKMEKISRLEIIGTKGREVIHYSDMSYDIQDNGRTLKVFISAEHEDEVLPLKTEELIPKEDVKNEINN